MSDNKSADEYRRCLPVPLTKLNGKSFCQYLEETLLEAGVEARRIVQGEVLFSEGEPGDSAFFIRKGTVDIKTLGRDGDELLLNRLGPGELFGEMALLDRTQRSASAVARGEVELLVITRDEITSLLREVPQTALWIIGLLSHRLRMLTRMASQMEQARAVNLKILAGQEEERRRIGRDIHDGVAQSFVASILRLQRALQILGRDPDEARSELAVLETGLRDNLETLRELIYNLFPSELRRSGLVGAIRQLTNRFASSAGLRLSFDHHGLDEKISSSLEAALFCIVQEAFNNVMHHARASEVHVDLSFDGKDLTLAISDDGCGFDLNKLLTNRNGPATYGLLSMQERANLAGGSMDIQSQPGSGTRLYFVVPAHPGPG